MEDMLIISVDDHISEAEGIFDRHLSGRALATAPRLMTTPTGTNYWPYQGMKLPSVGLNAVAGRMSADEGAVIDPQLRVRGVDALRVVDISIMPTLVSGNTNGPAMMIGLRAADFILRR